MEEKSKLLLYEPNGFHQEIKLRFDENGKVRQFPVNQHKAMRSKLVVAVNMSQKDDFEIDLAPGIRIWMNKDWGPDGKVTNPSLAIVKSVGEGITDIEPGDMILCHHNAFDRVVSNGYLHGHIGRDGKLDLFSLEYSMVWLKVDTDGNAHPLAGYLTVDRIEEPLPDTVLELTDLSKGRVYQNRFKILELGPGCDDLEVGMVIETDKFSDIDVHYSWNHTERKVIRVKYSDVFLIHHDQA